MKNVTLPLFAAIVLLFSACSKEDPKKNATGMRITKVTILEFPATESNGAGWDLTSGPDVTFRITKGTSCGAATFEPSTHYENATPGIALEWDVNYYITDVNANWSVCVYDYDTIDADDFMGGLYFRPQDKATGAASSALTLQSGSIKLRLDVTWQY